MLGVLAANIILINCYLLLLKIRIIFGIIKYIDSIFLN